MGRSYIVCIFAVVIFGLVGCSNKEPILIGLAVELTGKQADVGINVRDAAQMAVDEINAQGGVNGRSLQLVIRDDEGDPDVARRVDSELVGMGAVAIIGHYTSGQVEAVLDQMNAAEVVLFSPSASSSEFSGKDDYFFRLIPDTTFIGHKLAEHIANEHSADRLLVVYDDNNRSFSESFWIALDDGFRSFGGETDLIVFRAGQTDMEQLALQIIEKDPAGVTIIASAVDTAVLVQYLRKSGFDLPLFTSPWAQTTQLIEKGGQAVEGLEVGAFYNHKNQNEAHLRFSKKFQERFKRTPQLGTSQAYEIVFVLAHCLNITKGEQEGLRDALYTIKNFSGILGPITFDNYGDVRRAIYIMRVEDGQFIEKSVIFPESP